MSSSDTIEAYKKYVMTSSVKKVEPVVIRSANGATITDADGKRYVDCFAGISVVNSGHCNASVVEAAKKQLDLLVHGCTYVYYIQPVAELAKKLAEISPAGLQKTFFSNSGAEAIETALKLSRKFTKKHEIIALMRSFHGRTIGTLSVTGQAGRRHAAMGPYLGSIAFAPTPYCYRCPLGLEYPSCGIQCAKMIDEVVRYSTSNDVAAFIAEPLLGEGGIIVPPKEYFKEAKKILDAYGILFIDDEVQTGFARTGQLFGINHYGEVPDIMCLAKAIANGLPLGGTIARANIADSFEPGDHLSTFGGNPVCCAAALANINFILENDLPARASKTGEHVMHRLEELKEKHEIIGDVRGKGLMVGIELVKDRENKTPATEETGRIRDLCREKGVLVGSGGTLGNVLRIQPPLVISVEELDLAIDTIDKALGEAVR
ncbi:MAG TPA: aspartate aminotransferase family protein [archaeon]|nr:aspartate aminotransferase family protein [Candidatus Dormibacteraeota bacterium]HYB84830.1 aspartate aminotransferase family protein [archaeon]